MAVIKAVSSKAGIGTAIDYVTKEEKTEQTLLSGLNCNPDTVKEEMQVTKKLWGKTDGRTYKHFVQSFAPDEKIDPVQAHQLACRLAAERPEWEGFEVLIATHKDREHIHTHFIVNSVSFEDGHKLQQSKVDLQEMKEHSDRLCLEQGLHITEKGKTFDGQEREETTSFNKDTYQLLKRAEQGEVKSYVQDIALAVMDCREKASSREDFIRLMREKGYSVAWKDNHKYITFTDIARQEQGEKKCKIRNNKLEKYYNIDFGKESMECEFERNARTKEAGKQPYRTTARVKHEESAGIRKQSAEGSFSFVEQELRRIDEAVKSSIGEGRAEQAERCRMERSDYKQSEGSGRRSKEQQQSTEKYHRNGNWEIER